MTQLFNEYKNCELFKIILESKVANILFSFVYLCFSLVIISTKEQRGMALTFLMGWDTCKYT